MRVVASSVWQQRGLKCKPWLGTGCVPQLVLVLSRSAVGFAQQEAHEPPAEHDRKKPNLPFPSATMGYCTILPVSKYRMAKQPYTLVPASRNIVCCIHVTSDRERERGGAAHAPTPRALRPVQRIPAPEREVW